VHVLTILENLHAFKDSPAHSRETDLGLDVIRNALSLDCHSLASIRDAILQQKSLGFDLNVSSLAIWKAAVRSIRPGDIALASAILIGASRLMLLEPLAPKESASAPKHAESWNSGFQRASEYITDLFERLQDFDPQELQGLMGSPGAAQSLFYAVFSGHAEIQQSAATIIKSMGSRDSRREGVKFLMENYFVMALLSIHRLFAAWPGATCFHHAELCSNWEETSLIVFVARKMVSFVPVNSTPRRSTLLRTHGRLCGAS